MRDIAGFNAAWKKVRQRWEHTKSIWNDPVSRQFEQNMMVSLGEQMQQTQHELERLIQTIEQAQRNMR